MGSPARRATLAYVDGGILHELIVDVLNRLLVSRRGRSRLGLLEALYRRRSKESAPYSPVEFWGIGSRSLTEGSWGSIAFPAAILREI